MMPLSSSTWYHIKEIFNLPATALADGTCLYTASEEFEGCQLELLSLHPADQRVSLQLNLLNVPATAIDRISEQPDARSLLRESMVYLKDDHFGWDLVIRLGGRDIAAEGHVFMELTLSGDGPDLMGLQARHHEVDTAWERGLLDDEYWARANFKLSSRPTRARLEALWSSNHVPEDNIRLRVVFGASGDTYTNEDEDDEIAPVTWSLADVQFLFRPRARHRGFRMTDLFRSN